MAAKKAAVKNKAAPKVATGRPSAYRPEFADLAKELCSLGAIDKDLARSFKVSTQTLNAWKKAHPEFLDALKAAKEEADAKVERSLYERANGYEHPEVHISNFQGVITLTPLTKRYPPDTTAAIFWLKNRRPVEWRDRTEVEHSGNIGFAEKLVRARERAKRS